MNYLSRVFAKIKQFSNHKTFRIWNLKNWNLFRISDFGFRIFQSKQAVGIIIALIVSGLIISLIFPTGNPDVLAAGFLTSTTELKIS